MKRTPLLIGLGLLASGCVTRTEYIQNNAEMRRLMLDTQARVSQVQRELDRLRGDVDTGSRTAAAAAAQQRINVLEDRVRQAEAATRSATLSDPRDIAQPSGTTTATSDSDAVPTTTIVYAAVTTSTMPPPPPRVDIPEEWAHEVNQEQAVAGTQNSPDKAEFLAIMELVSRRECGKAIDQLNGFVTRHKDSALADNALYWAARCYMARGDQNQAISKYYEVGTKYPKGDRTPAALLAQANLFLGMGNTPDARIVLSRLTSYYPNSEEAATARKKLAELQR